MARPCSICTHPDRKTIDQQLLNGTPYRTVGKQHTVGVSAVFRHRRDHLTKLMAQAVEARGVQELGYGDDLLGQLEYLNGKTLKILDEAEAMGDRRVALAAIREARSTIELNAKLCGQIREQHLHLHGHTMLSPEAAEQFIEAMATMQKVVGKLPKGDIRDDPHILSGAEALPRAASFDGIDDRR